ncbi:cytidylyltransferase-like domain-containing protein [Hirsutella rhossiliensis]|uniref:Nicotinamide-nucleotide adenylyltransferase n=1 Tax=Hirsutella rhossiliensis TaxID=111463 RepID=A0A9P8MUN8_9HYPO|nr:cytidylyltransferase-like domain-containing protein [Hirsutella rhossiliensis]KAH0961555.1 cytidylyltransferase-like domain-containing protein [Hirsutella rhossiliensis]
MAPVPQQPPATQTPPAEPLSAPYTFPHHKLKRRVSSLDRVPVVLVACGSFSPITVLHLQMFEMTQRYVQDTAFQVVGSYLSPVSDAYNKPSLARAHHRVAMCSLAVEDGTGIMVDPWETLRCNQAGEPVYTRTVDTLRHFDHEINDVLGGIQALDGSHKRARIVLLIGADVAMTMSDPNLWSPSDLDVILGCYGAFIVERPTQTDIQKALEPLKHYDKIWVVSSFYNDVSSTKIRAQLQNRETVMDLPKLVYEYIKLHGLYQGSSLQGQQKDGR